MVFNQTELSSKQNFLQSVLNRWKNTYSLVKVKKNLTDFDYKDMYKEMYEELTNYLTTALNKIPEEKFPLDENKYDINSDFLDQKELKILFKLQDDDFLEEVESYVTAFIDSLDDLEFKESKYIRIF